MVIYNISMFSGVHPFSIKISHTDKFEDWIKDTWSVNLHGCGWTKVHRPTLARTSKI